VDGSSAAIGWRSATSPRFLCNEDREAYHPRVRLAPSALLAVALSFVAFVGACDKCNTSTATDADAASSAAGASTVAPPVPATTWDAKVKATALADGKAVMIKHECRRCHEIDDLPAAARPLGCTSCHLFLAGLKPEDPTYKGLVEKWGEGIIVRYQRNIQHLEKVPDLTGLGKRVRGDYIARFLAEPYDQRPTLEESMFRHKLTDDEIKAVARYFAAVSDAPDPSAAGYAPELPRKPDGARLAQGKQLFLSKGCMACHTYGNVKTGMTREALEGARTTTALAPNLRFVKDRSRPDAILSWIMNPQALAPKSLMPNVAATRDEAEALRDFLYFGDPELLPAPATYEIKPPAILDRKVPYTEMKERVLGKVCVHCHMNDYEKDTGPGNKGGFGYAGIGLAMRSYEALVNGAVGLDGKRYSVLVTRPGEAMPPVLSAMMDRRVEEQRDHVPAFGDYERPAYPKKRPGMPMGLPSMTDEEMSILATWISQGCKGPTEILGKPGVNDGYLVQDGPLKKNEGCELRPPEKPRPKWAYDQK